MKFKKGSKVEILGNTDRLGVGWHCARIISGNGHTYSVQYDCSNEASAERVPRKAIRPCPPLIKCIGSWEVNDIVEVYVVGYWKTATVLKYTGRDFYLVRLWVSCKELKVHKVNTRVCQSWENGQWIVKPQGLGNSGVWKPNRNLISNSYKIMSEVQQARNVCSPGLDSSDLHEPYLASSITLKRAFPHGSFPIEEYPRKKRVIVNMGECERFKAVSTDQLPEKVDVIAYPQNNMGEECMYYSFTNSSKQYYETRKETPCTVTTHFPETIEELDCSCSNLSSVGSCSVISGSANNIFGDTSAGPCQDEDILCSDADSVDIGDMDKGCTIYPKEVLAEGIHRLELNAYLSTLQAMYAYGPLSWEKEELLTNLRISLNISNDEHLMGIKELVFGDQNF